MFFNIYLKKHNNIWIITYGKYQWLVMAQIIIVKCIHILYLSTKHKQKYLG